MDPNSNGALPTTQALPAQGGTNSAALIQAFLQMQQQSQQQHHTPSSTVANGTYCPQSLASSLASATTATPPALGTDPLLAQLAQLAGGASQLVQPQTSPSTEALYNLLLQLLRGTSGGAQQVVAGIDPQKLAAALVAANPSLLLPSAASSLLSTPSTLAQQSSTSAALQAVAAQLSTATLPPVTATASGLPSLLLPGGGGSASDVLAQQFPMLTALAELQRQQQQQRQLAEVAALQALLQRHQQPQQAQHPEQTPLASLSLLSQAVASQHNAAPSPVPPTTTASRTNLSHSAMQINDAPPQLHRQSPPKAPSPKKRRRLNDSPISKRKRSMPPVEINVPNMASPEVEIDVVNCSRTNSFSVPPTSMGQNSSQKLDSLKSLLESSNAEGPSKPSATSVTVNALKPPARTIDPNSPHRHHPDNLPKRNPEAALLEDFATVYMLNGFSDVNRQELQKTLENALRELRTEDASQSAAASSGKPEDSAYSSSVSSRAASSSNPPEAETPANGVTDGQKAGEKKENSSNNNESSTWLRPIPTVTVGPAAT